MTVDAPADPGLRTIAERESLLLAPYAMHSCDSRGRKLPEAEHPYRGPFQRDRDRILHSAAYRRLSGKMQVFTGDMGDYHRTRLTHTQEVASIARTLGRALRLNEDLIEALALLHDIGHPPYGHAGEETLDELLASEGGFSHNGYALTLVEELESRYAPPAGLNLTLEVLEGQAARADKSSPGGRLLEVQVVDLADSITYNAHDTDDAVALGLVELEELAEIPLVRETLDGVGVKYGSLRGERLRKAVVHDLIDRQTTDILRHAGLELAARQPASASAAVASGIRLAGSSELRQRTEELERFLYQHVYRHEDLMAVRRGAQERLRAIFAGYLRRPELLPRRFRQRAKKLGRPRAVAEYLAGMTDHYCDSRYRTLFAP